MFENLYKNIGAWAAKIPFDTLVWVVWGSFAAAFVAAILICAISRAAKYSSKRPFFCLVCAYTAATFALFLTVNPVTEAAFTACIFWLCGYLGYGILCLISFKRRERPTPAIAAASPAPTIRSLPATPAPAPVTVRKTPQKGAPNRFEQPAKNNVRLEHAIAVTEKLLLKNLGKTDRQELEKLKNTLEVLKIKGALSPAEGEILNENFNTLLKLMAKYNI